MRLIKNWSKKKLICNRCGIDKSVKYMGDDNKPYCNRCIMLIDFIERERLNE